MKVPVIGLSGKKIQEAVRGNYREQVFIGRSAAFKSVEETICAIAPRNCSVIISGETGTGKELVARRIHANSKRTDKIFIPVDCTTLTGQLFESQLFGHVKGAFTGAFSDTLGFFRAADGGTIFLDEISELPLDLQAKFLRVLQEERVTPLGSIQSYPVDLRVLCATNCNLRDMLRDGKFRADLYYRLNVVNIELPPLRERRDDIVILAEYFLAKQAKLYNEPMKKLNKSAIKILTSYNWPGNVREIANVMERAYVLSKSREIGPSELSMGILTNDLLPQNDHEFPAMDDVNKKLVVRALQAAKGRKMAAARLLRIDHRKLGRLIERYNLQPTY